MDNIREIRMEANRYSIVFESKSLLKRYELCWDKRVVRYIDSFDVHKRKDCIYNLIRYMNQDNVNTYFILFKNYSKRNPQVLLIHSLRTGVRNDGANIYIVLQEQEIVFSQGVVLISCKGLER